MTPRFYYFCIGAIIAFALSITMIETFFTWKWFGVDIPFHITIARMWVNGTIFSNPYVMDINGMPYPPLFHWIIAPFSALGIDTQFMFFLQIIFLPLTLLSVAIVTAKLLSPKAALLAVLSLFGSMSFLDRCMQPIPQTLDMILFPILIYAVIRSQGKRTVGIASAMIWNHGPYAALLIGGILTKITKKQFLAILAICSPILAMTIYYAQSALAHIGFGVTATRQEEMFWINPLGFTVTYLGLFFMASVLFLAYWFIKHKNFTPLDKILIGSLIGLSFLIPTSPDRMLEYIPIPLAVLTAEKYSGNKWIFAFAVVSALFMMYQYLVVIF